MVHKEGVIKLAKDNKKDNADNAKDDVKGNENRINKQVHMTQGDVEKVEFLRRKTVLTPQERLELAELESRAEAHRESSLPQEVSGSIREDAQDEQDKQDGNGRKTGAE